jgi:hypothetical protein
MPPSTDLIDAWAARLVKEGVAGPHRSHSHSNNMGKLRRTLEGDPDCTFGLSGLDALSYQEALEAMTSVAGWRPEEPTDYIDPLRTIAGAMEAGRLCRRVAARGGDAIVATGHPDCLLRFLDGVADLLEEAGMGIRTDPVPEGIKAGWRLRSLEYEGRVAVLADEWGAVHTHSPEGMRALLNLGPPPQLVVADHGWAGAAMQAGIPTAATLDSNDPALALGVAIGREAALIPLDDGRPPFFYEPVLEAFTAGFQE